MKKQIGGCTFSIFFLCFKRHFARYCPKETNVSSFDLGYQSDRTSWYFWSSVFYSLIHELNGDAIFLIPIPHLKKIKK